MLVSRRRNEEIPWHRNQESLRNPSFEFFQDFLCKTFHKKNSARGLQRMRCRFVSLWTVHVNLMTLLWVSVKHIWAKKQVHVQSERERERIHASGLMLNSVVLFIYIYVYIIITTHTVLYLFYICCDSKIDLLLKITWRWIIRFFGLWTYWLQWLQWLQYHCDKYVCPCYIDFFLSFRNAGMHCTCVSSCHHGPIIPKPFIETLAKQYFTFVITTYLNVMLPAVFNLSETFIMCIQDLFI